MPTPLDTRVEYLRAQVISLMEANRMLIADQQDFLDADQSTHEAAGRYRAVARNYLDALALFAVVSVHSR